MARILWALIVGLVSLASLPALAQDQEKRLALVIGNGSYEAAPPLQTAANDAGLIAQTLQAAGFDVIGARDLDGETLRKSFRDFVQKVQEAGPNTVAFVYLAGYGLQLTGENYFVPVDAKIARDTDVPVEAIRLSDYTHQLSALQIKASVIVLDAARSNPFAKGGQPLAGGLALVDPDPKMLIAFNSAPGTVAPDGAPPYGPYAQALAEMIRTGGLSLPDVFDRVRLRVNEMTKGAQIPWDAQKIDAPFVFFDRKLDAPPAQADAAMRSKPIRDYSAQDAYAAALERDTMQGYEDYLQAYPNDPLAKRVRAILAARREAITWRRTYSADTPDAYWSYLNRYPRGPHAADARRRLAYLSAALEPPPQFTAIDYDVPPPPPDEVVYVDRPVLYYGDPVFDFEPPPPPPVFFLPPPPPDFVVLPPPPPPIGLFVLPTPFFVAMPGYVAPPPYVVPPPNNIVFNNIHNTTIINTVINNPNPTPAQLAAAGVRPTVPGGPISRAPSLPPAALQRANLVQPGGPQGGQPGPGARPGMLPTQPGAAPSTSAATAPNNPAAPGAHTLPGARNGPPLPQTAPANPAQPGARPNALTPGRPATALAPANAPAQGVIGRPTPGARTNAPAAGKPPTAPPPSRAATAPTSTLRPSGAPVQTPAMRAAPARPAPAMRSAPARAAVTPPPASRPTPPPRVVAPPPPPRRTAAVPPPQRAVAPPPRVAPPPPARVAPAPPPRVAAPPPPRPAMQVQRAAPPPPRMAAPPPPRMAAPPPPRMAPPAPPRPAAAARPAPARCPPGRCPH